MEICTPDVFRKVVHVVLLMLTLLRDHMLCILVVLLEVPEALILMMLSLYWDEVHWLLVLKISISEVILVVELAWVYTVVLFFIFNDVVVLSLFDDWVVLRGDIFFV